MNEDGGIIEDEECRRHNEGIKSAIECFHDFIRPLDEAGACAYNPVDDTIVHVGPPLKP